MQYNDALKYIANRCKRLRELGITLDGVERLILVVSQEMLEDLSRALSAKLGPLMEMMAGTIVVDGETVYLPELKILPETKDLRGFREVPEGEKIGFSNDELRAIYVGRSNNVHLVRCWLDALEDRGLSELPGEVETFEEAEGEFGPRRGVKWSYKGATFSWAYPTDQPMSVEDRKLLDENNAEIAVTGIATKIIATDYPEEFVAYLRELAWRAT